MKRRSKGDHGRAPRGGTRVGRGDRQRPRPSASPPADPARPPPNLEGFFNSPQRNLIGGVVFIVLVTTVATLAYMSQGWSLRDAFYMVIMTVYTVGYEEVQPVNSNFLYFITITLIILGCTGMIFLTGVVVQFFTLNQINKIAGQKKMEQQIEQVKGHVIVCGFGRVGMVLGQALRRSSASFVLIEESEARIAEARAAGYLCLCGDWPANICARRRRQTRACARQLFGQ